ncbi:MAG TPA: BamA/TamA family outer membrane protein, partial [Dongiaceae bacterium]|nr:BamA/TamA family outer membrane protein [Dongiaceae bacterium]
VVSWWNLDHSLRDNPAIDEGDAHSVFIRLERLARPRHGSRSGLYHWIELERSGGPTLRGDFDYTRALADLRSVVRVLPATTLSLRVVGGSALEGTLPPQREFVIGGVDGLRAHEFGAYRGDRVAMGQAEYSIALHALGSRVHVRGPRALLFLDSGTAWKGGGAGGELAQQHFAVDGGVGLATPDDDLRVTFARNLQDPDAKFVVAVRLNRPF